MVHLLLKVLSAGTHLLHLTIVLALLYIATLQAEKYCSTCATLCLAKFADACGTADGQSGSAVLAACTARRWLAHNAAGVKYLDVGGDTGSSLHKPGRLPAGPGAIKLRLDAPLMDLGSLLEALAWCPRLMSLDIIMMDCMDEDEWLVDAPNKYFPVLACAPAFAKLRSLTKLALSFGNFGADPDTLSVLVDALVPLTGLAELHFHSSGPAVIPASLRELKGLRSLEFRALAPCVFEAGCLDLPTLQSLELDSCAIRNADMLLGITALQRTDMHHIQRQQGTPGVCSACAPAAAAACSHSGISIPSGAGSGLCRLPADMGSLCATLLHMDCSGQGLTQFPLALTQLRALNCLDAAHNDFDSCLWPSRPYRG